MMSWCSLFLPCDDANIVVSSLHVSLQTLGYTPFNPFGLMPGLTYPQAVRLFIAPSRSGWVRVIGEPDDAQLPLISQTIPCLRVSLNGTQARIETYAGGEQKSLEAVLSPYLKSGVSADMLHQSLAAQASAQPTATGNMALLHDALPDEIKAMKVDTHQAQKMFERLSAGLTQRSGNAGNESQVRDLLAGDKADWNSAGGAEIRALIDCLTIPSGWQNPDFVTLRDAYQLHKRRERNPNAMLYPGDAEAINAVPDALDYQIVYAGKG